MSFMFSSCFYCCCSNFQRHFFVDATCFFGRWMQWLYVVRPFIKIKFLIISCCNLSVRRAWRYVSHSCVGDLDLEEWSTLSCRQWHTGWGRWGSRSVSGSSVEEGDLKGKPCPSPRSRSQQGYGAVNTTRSAGCTCLILVYFFVLCTPLDSIKSFC